MNCRFLKVNKTPQEIKEQNDRYYLKLCKLIKENPFFSVFKQDEGIVLQYHTIPQELNLDAPYHS